VVPILSNSLLSIARGKTAVTDSPDNTKVDHALMRPRNRRRPVSISTAYETGCRRGCLAEAGQCMIQLMKGRDVRKSLVKSEASLESLGANLRSNLETTISDEEYCNRLIGY